MRDDIRSGETDAPQADMRKRSKQDARTATLRLLATTDLHMQLRGHDYIRDRPTGHHGLAGLATMIKTARAQALEEGAVCLLLDNGDLFEGGPLGDALARMPVSSKHPAIAALNGLAYDAIGLGNHDLDHGVPFLAQVAAHLDAPLLSTNFIAPPTLGLHRKVLITRQALPDKTLKIGVLSVLPEATSLWHLHALKGRATIEAALASVQQAQTELRLEGADIVVLLAHMGLHHAPRDNALTLALHGAVDAVIMGHTHRRFPGDDHAGIAGVDPEGGTLAACPAIMPGHDASDLACLDLHLSHNTEDGWRCLSHKARLIPNSAQSHPAPEILRASDAAHAALRKHLAKPVGETTEPLHTYFALLQPSALGALLAEAKARMVAEALRDTPLGSLPILATTAAHTSGGLEGPGHYIDISAGAVLERHIAGMAPYINKIWALRITGAILRQWLENAAMIYTQLEVSHPTQRLTAADIPSFNCDTVYGVQYRIDPSRKEGDRIRDLKWRNGAVEDNQIFILATNQFRAGGGGGLISASDVDPVLESSVALPSALRSLFACGPYAPGEVTRPWRLQTDAGCRAIVETSPLATRFVEEIAAHAPHCLGLTQTGFQQIQVTL